MAYRRTRDRKGPPQPVVVQAAQRPMAPGMTGQLSPWPGRRRQSLSRSGWWRPKRQPCWTQLPRVSAVWLVWILCLLPVRALTAEPLQILDVQPGRAGELVVCRLVTSGLPGEKVVLSMRSGLVSSLEVFLDLLNERQKVLAGNRISFQLAFDLWEEVYAIRGDSQQYRFSDLTGLVAFLSDLVSLPVATHSALSPAERYRIRAGLVLHPIASTERDRIERVIGGDNRSARPGDGQEVTVGLGQLIRFFYQDGSNRPRSQVEAVSRWFRAEELDDETD